ncbi:MAG: hypothetical protein AB1345_14930 [Chloroflexota bacterium]
MSLRTPKGWSNLIPIEREIASQKDARDDMGVKFLNRMPLVGVEDVLAYSGDVGVFGARGVMAITQGFAVFIEQFFRLGGSGFLFF